MTSQLRGFAADRERARAAGTYAKSKQSPDERSRRSREAAYKRWAKYRRSGLEYEDMPSLEPMGHKNDEH